MEIAGEIPDSVDTMLLQLRLSEALAHRAAPGDGARALEILQAVETKARRIDAGIIVARNLPECRAEVVALNATP